jgi:hypothetical protein
MNRTIWTLIIIFLSLGKMSVAAEVPLEKLIAGYPKVNSPKWNKLVETRSLFYGYNLYNGIRYVTKAADPLEVAAGGAPDKELGRETFEGLLSRDLGKSGAQALIQRLKTIWLDLRPSYNKLTRQIAIDFDSRRPLFLGKAFYDQNIFVDDKLVKAQIHDYVQGGLDDFPEIEYSFTNHGSSPTQSYVKGNAVAWRADLTVLYFSGRID